MAEKYPIKPKIISQQLSGNMKALNRRIHTGTDSIAYKNDPHDVDFLVKELDSESANAVRTPAATDHPEVPIELVRLREAKAFKPHVARCLYLNHHRADVTFIERPVPEKLRCRPGSPWRS